MSEHAQILGNGIRERDAVIEQLKAEAAQRTEAFEAAIAQTAGDAMEHRLCGMNLHAAIRRAEQAEAAIARVREIHPRETTGFGSDVCGICFNEHEDSATWPCPTIAALERSDLPAVRAFAAEHDPRGEAT